MRGMKKIAKMLLLSMFLSSTPLYAESILTLMSDSVNSGIVNTKVLASDKLSNAKINATVVNGIVTFNGVVNSKEQLNELIRIGNSISGVKGVDVSKVKVAN